MVQLLAALVCLGSTTRVANMSVQDRNVASLSELRPMIERYQADRGALSRFYDLRMSPTRSKVLRGLASQYRDELSKVDFDGLSRSGQIDWLLMENHLKFAIDEFDIRDKEVVEVADMLPFQKDIIDWADAKRELKPVDAEKAAARINEMSAELKAVRQKLEEKDKASPIRTTLCFRAANYTDQLRESLKDWYEYGAGYDPEFTWWLKQPTEAFLADLQAYSGFLRDTIGGVARGDTRTIIGDPIGRDALIHELRSELIPYTPEDLLKIADREFKWCEAEMIKASREMGFGDDWKKALEKVKNDHVKPGEQPEMIRQLAVEAIEFVEKNDLMTVPPLAKTTWRMEMMSAQQQLVSPFFLGGETIMVSYPTEAMDHNAKMMSMRGNNRHFARATVHHELIPGHHMQQFMTSRYATHRDMFGTPFWIEGWALWWEFLLWDKNFAKSPENRVGMLFWRMHRCARIIFSLGFHLGQMTPQECIDLLVDKVGHERANAEAEVRRSFGGGYGPLYQLAYMMGGLQFRGLYKELVEGKKMTARQFHDAILRQGDIPVSITRLAITDTKLSKNMPMWYFDMPPSSN